MIDSELLLWVPPYTIGLGNPVVRADTRPPYSEGSVDTYDMLNTSTSRLVRLYACSVAEKLIPEAKTRMVREAVTCGREMADGKPHAYESSRILRQLKALSDHDSIRRRVAREAGLLCVSPTVSIGLLTSVVSTMQRPNRDFDAEIVTCVAPARPRRRVQVVQADVLAMASRMYGSQDWGIGPVLADAVEEYGVLDTEAAEHLRQPHHWRGCWVLDELLGY